jgi:hypothetical protein
MLSVLERIGEGCWQVSMVTEVAQVRCAADEAPLASACIVTGPWFTRITIANAPYVCFFFPGILMCSQKAEHVLFLQQRHASLLFYRRSAI